MEQNLQETSQGNVDVRSSRPTPGDVETETLILELEEARKFYMARALLNCSIQNWPEASRLAARATLCSVSIESLRDPERHERYHRLKVIRTRDGVDITCQPKSYDEDLRVKFE